jgi:hypothetical protein
MSVLRRGPAHSNIGPVVLVFAIVAALYFAREILIPLAFALTLTFLLTPAVTFLEKLRVGRVLPVILTVLVSMAAAGWITWVIANQLVDVASQLPTYRQNIHAKILVLGNSGRLHKGLATGRLPMLRANGYCWPARNQGCSTPSIPMRREKIVWQVRIGKGGVLGGIEWGPAADEEAVYAALSDIDSAKPEQGGGLFAIRISTGEKIWYAAPPKPPCLGKSGCTAAQMAPVTVIPDVVFSGSMDGHIRAYSTAGGKLLWDFNTLRSYDTVNGIKAGGGSLNARVPRSPAACFT